MVIEKVLSVIKSGEFHLPPCHLQIFQGNLLKAMHTKLIFLKIEDIS